MNRRNTKRKDRITIFIMVFGLILGINLVVAALCPDWTHHMGKNTVSFLDSCFDNSVVLKEGDRNSVSAAQGGVNVLKARDNAEKAKSNVEGGGSLGSGNTGDEGATESPAPETVSTMALPDPPPADPAQKKDGKSAETLDPEMLKKALVYFQNSLMDRDVIWEGQTEPVRPYVSKSFRDNPFDKVEETNIQDTLKLNVLPPPGWYPPPDERGPEITAKEFEAYLKTISLNGIVVIEDRFYAVIKAGTKTFTKGVGDDFKDRMVVTIVDISFDSVLLSDEFGNKGLVGFNYARGFEAQSIDDVLYLSHFSNR